MKKIPQIDFFHHFLAKNIPIATDQTFLFILLQF